MKILLLYIKKINIFAFLILLVVFPIQTKSEKNIFTESPIIVNPESEYEGFLIDLIIDKMVYHYYKIQVTELKNITQLYFYQLAILHMEKFIVGKVENFMD